MEAILYSETNILCILVLLMVYLKASTTLYNQNEKHFFKWVLLSNCLFFALDAAWVFADKSSFLVAPYVNWALNALYYMLSGVVGYVWFLYSETAQNSRLVGSKKGLFVCSLPMIAMAVLTLLSLKTGWLFYVDEANIYHRGPLYFIQLLFSYGYVIITAVKALVLSIRTQSYARRQELRMLALFVVPTLLGGLVQVLIPGISILCVGTTFGILYIFTTTQEYLISVDGLTGLNNRNSFIRCLSDRMGRHGEKGRLYLLMMDLDYFKQINDKYGHVEGDNALRRTADAFKSYNNNQRFYFSRYGGDEFAAVCELEPHEKIEDVCKSIHDSIGKSNAGHPYSLAISIGCAKYDSSVKTYQDFIKLADAELYKVKQAR